MVELKQGRWLSSFVNLRSTFAMVERFHILDIATSTDQGEQRAYLRWRMSGRVKSWPHTDLGLEGMSEVHVGKDGLVCLHLDHWDSASQLLARLPFIGALLRLILRLFIVRMDGN